MALPKKTGVWRPARYASSVEGVGRPLQEFHVVAQFLHLGAQQLIQPRVVKALDGDDAARAPFRVRIEKGQFFCVEVVGAAETLPHPDRPGHGGALDLEVVLDVVQQVEGLASFPVQFVDEGHDRRMSQTADLQQFLRLAFNPLDRVDHHQDRVNGGQHPVGILGKVVMAGGVQQVYLAPVIIEFHHRRGDRDAALLLQFHLDAE